MNIILTLLQPSFKDNEPNRTLRARALFIFLLVYTASLLHGQETAPNRILFVGNSYTYFWNLPQQVQAMSESEGVQITTRQSTSGGANLGQHWRGEKKLQTVDLIKSGDFDIVVLQDHSMRALKHPDSLLYFGKLLADLARENNARLYLYLTWARAYDPLMQPQVTETYEKLAKEIDAEIVPVGQAWMRARALRPGLPLYDPDESHPSPLGTYLTACVFYGKLTGKSPVGLPERLIARDSQEEKLYLNIQSKTDALFCQKVAEEILANYNRE